MTKITPLFICGMSRGGTTWLGNCLNEHPNVAVFGESLFWGRNFIKPTGKNGSYTLEEVKQVLHLLAESCTAFLGEGKGKLKNVKKDNWKTLINEIEVASCTPSELFYNICLKISEKERIAHVIEKTPHHVNWIPRIVKAYPDTKLVIMVRDAYGFMLSYKYQGSHGSKEARAFFKALYHPVACSLIWRRYMLSALEMSTHFPKQTYVVEFEDLKNKPELCWQNVLSFLGIVEAPFIEVRDHNSSFVSERKTLSSVDVFWMNLIAGEAIQKGGYVKKKSGVRPSEVLLSTLSLILWIFRMPFLLRHHFPSEKLKYFLKIIK